MRELRKTQRQIERELQSDLKHLQRKAICLIDKLVLAQGEIQTVKLRLRMMGSYVLPDGITR